MPAGTSVGTVERLIEATARVGETPLRLIGSWAKARSLARPLHAMRKSIFLMPLKVGLNFGDDGPIPNRKDTRQ